MISIKSGLRKDVLVTLVAQLTIMVLALILNKVLSVRLGVDGYGEYSIIRKSTQVLSFVMLSGMGIAIPRYLALHLAKGDQSRSRSTLIASLLVIGTVSLVLLLVCLWFQPIFAPIVTGSNTNSLYFTALLYALSITFSSWLFAYYRGTNAFLNFGIAQVAVQLLILLGAFFFGDNLLLVLNVWSVVTIAYVLAAMSVELWKKKDTSAEKPNWKGSILPELKTLFRYGLPRMAGDFFLFSFAAFPLVYINETLGIKASSYYATGLTLTSMVTPLFGFLGMVLLPYVSTAMVQNNFGQVDKLLKKLGWIYLALSALAILVLEFGMELFIRFFFSLDFLPSSGVSRVLIASILFESIYLLLRNPIDAVSTFPYNSLNLLISLLLLVALFSCCDTLEAYAYSFLLVTTLKAILSTITWHYCRKKYKSSVS